MNDKARNINRPPWVAENLLKIFLRNGLKEQRLGEFEEIFQYLVESEGIQKAKLWYWGHTLKSIPYLIYDTIYWGVIMFSNYLKIAIRHIVGQKFYSLINVLGLSIGIASCILIMLWVKDELSYDRFHKNTDTVYRVTEHQYNSSGDYFPVAVTPWPLSAALKADFPEIVESSRLRIMTNRLISYNNHKYYEDNFVAVDPSFLKMFTFPLVKGNSSTALTQPFTILITESTAKKYFGNDDPIGKILNYNSSTDFTITGILKDVPQNSHIKFDFLVPFESTLHEFGWSESWWTNSYYTYIQLLHDADVNSLSAKVSDYMKTLNPQAGEKIILQPISDIHLYSDYAIDLYGSTENTVFYIYAFSIIALFILIIACINFMNLSTARSEKRLKEIGLRKVVGARRTQIISQFYGESLLITFTSFITSLILVNLLLPVFNNVAGKTLSIESLTDPLFILGLLVIIVATGLIAGSYPALVLSSFRPVESIGNNGKRFSSKSGKSIFRRALVIVQFTLTVILLVGMVTVHQQINFIFNKNLGYEKNSVLYFNKRANIDTQYDVFKSQLLSDPNITGVTCSSDLPTYTVHSTTAFIWEGKDPETHFFIHQFSVDHDYIQTFNMNIIAGRDFSKQFPVDDSTQSFILNEAAVKAMGLKDPVGKQFQLYDNIGKIIGIVEDFHFKSLQSNIEPLVLRIEPRRDWYVLVKFNSGNMKEAVDTISKVYSSFNPDFPLHYTLLDEDVKQLYTPEERTKQIFDYFTIIALIISCLGLYGLSSYMAEQKTKEIGIRKVLGASITNIISTLSKESIILVCVSNLLAWPIAYIVMKNWLDNYAYRIELDFWIFIIGGIISLLIALFTISYQSVKAATANPIDSIKYE